MSNNYVQPVNSQDLYNYQLKKTFSMIDNYVYLYHTDTIIAIPTYPESISDTLGVNYNQTTPLSRSAPIYTYQSSGPRSFQVTLNLHRDMMSQINTELSKLDVPDLNEEDYVDIMIKQLQAAAVPRYAASEKMVDPPLVAVRFGNEVFCKGVVTGQVGVTYSGPILRTGKYALAEVSFTINETEPYDADIIMKQGSLRGTLDRPIEKGRR